MKRAVVPSDFFNYTERKCYFHRKYS